MESTIYEGVIINYPSNMGEEEALVYFIEEQKAWRKKQKKLSSVTLSIEGNEIIIKAVEKSPVKRLRRITGYLSNVDNFNDAKQAEYKERYTHVGKQHMS
jgi:anaerobic ribonucleoside-triphosphate reductase activating protein